MSKKSLKNKLITSIIKNKECPLISIIIPTFNRVKIINRALNSVINQTYKNWELIIIDDNSIDNTEITVKKFIRNKKLENKTLYIKNIKNLGNAATRNVGIKKAQGKFIAFLDDDDEWLSKKLEKQIIRIIETKSDACFCGTLWLENNKVLKSRIKIGGPTSNWLLKNSVFKKIGFFDEKLPANVDGEFLIRLNKHPDLKLCLVKEYLYKHYYHEEQITSSSKNKIIGLEKTLKKHNKLLNNKEKGNLYFRLFIFYLFANRRRFDYLLKSLKYKFSLKNFLLLAIFILFPKAKIQKILINKFLDFLKYPKSFAGRYNK
jgi:glycosyltransferase involved in cell wall biosynthesis